MGSASDPTGGAYSALLDFLAGGEGGMVERGLSTPSLGTSPRRRRAAAPVRPIRIQFFTVHTATAYYQCVHGLRIELFITFFLSHGLSLLVSCAVPNILLVYGISKCELSETRTASVLYKS